MSTPVECGAGYQFFGLDHQARGPDRAPSHRHEGEKPWGLATKTAVSTLVGALSRAPYRIALVGADNDMVSLLKLNGAMSRERVLGCRYATGKGA
jgi:hypothetical protein